jgi:glycosyltransferase involved in cell wall biosynthesis
LAWGSDKFTTAPVEPWTRRLSGAVIHQFFRSGLLLYGWMLGVCRIIGRVGRRRAADWQGEIVLTGTFYSDNWAAAHLRPLANSNACTKLWIVTTYELSPIPNVVAVVPPRWMRRIIGDVPSRMLMFTVTVLRKRPAIVGGFHLLFNGLVAGLLGPLVGARSVYFCVGGPNEVVGGGSWAENRVFGLLRRPDKIVERRLIQAVGAFDMVVTMGTKAVTFHRERGVRTRFNVVSGGIDSARFRMADAPCTFDMILVGRLAEVKCVDLFLRAVERVRRVAPGASAVVVGDGPLRAELEALAVELGIGEAVRFVGHQTNVEEWLRKAKIFMLTSASEGLALSLMEAMMSGLAPVVSDVGDLGDLVEHGVNGYLIGDRSAEAFARPVIELLSDDKLRETVAMAARQAAMCHETARVTRRWDEILRGGGSEGAATRNCETVEATGSVRS